MARSGTILRKRYALTGVSVDVPLRMSDDGAIATPRVQLSNRSIAEDASVDDVIGTLSVSNGSGSYTFSITADPDSKFKIDGDELQVGAALDYETAASHSVTIEADNGVDAPISRTFSIAVENVIEAPVNLVAPVVTGDLDGILTCSTGTWELPDAAGATFAYQWKDADDDSDLTGETANALDTQDYIGLEVYCEVTATNSAGATAEDSNTVGPLEEAPEGPTVPDAFETGDWSIVAGDEKADVTINSLPANGGASITDIEYRLDGGSWVSSGGTSSFAISGLTNDQEYDVELRAVNSVGNGAAGDTKQVTPEDAGGPPPDDYLLTEDGDRIVQEDGTPIEVTGTIAGLPVATALDGTEWVFVVQDGDTVKCLLSDLRE